MSPQPALFKILDLAVTAMQATAGYVAPTGGDGIVVFDGPVSASRDAITTYLCIGWNANGDQTGTVTTGPWAFGSRADRLEEGTFDVTIVATSGDDNPSTVRGVVKTITGDLTAAVYGLTDSSFAGYWCDIESMDVTQYQTNSGVTVEATIRVHYKVQQVG